MPSKPVDQTALDKVELRPDGWDRFRAAVHAAAKSGPKHRPPKNAKESVVKDTGKA